MMMDTVFFGQKEIRFDSNTRFKTDFYSRTIRKTIREHLKKTKKRLQKSLLCQLQPKKKLIHHILHF